MSTEAEKPTINYIQYLRRNLLDTYKYGDGFTVFKELIQNAADASSNELKIYITDGVKKATNKALRTPGIIVYDDGKFDKKNKEGILKIADDNKTSESSKIGRYGLGMKSIFHICDLFFYAANTKEFPFKQIYPVNYWDDPENLRGYNSFTDEDIKELLNIFPEEIDIRRKQGFVLYIPVKEKGWENVSDQNIDSKAPFGSIENLTKTIPLCLALLSEVSPQEQEKRLHEITYRQAETNLSASVRNDKKLKYVKCESSVGNTKTTMETTFVSYKVPVSDVLISQFDKLKGSEFWSKEQKDNLKPEVYFEMLRTAKEKTSASAKLSIKFCVYLPLEEEYCSKVFDIDSEYNYTILMHGNFAVDSGRRGIRGFSLLTDKSTDELLNDLDSTESIQKLWNVMLAQTVLFPGLPLFLDECKSIINTDKDFFRIVDCLYITTFKSNDKEIRLVKNRFTCSKYGFAYIYEKKIFSRIDTNWHSFDITANNYLYLPELSDNQDLFSIFSSAKDIKSVLICKNENQNFILPESYNPKADDIHFLIASITANVISEKKYTSWFAKFIA